MTSLLIPFDRSICANFSFPYQSCSAIAIAGTSRQSSAQRLEVTVLRGHTFWLGTHLGLAVTNRMLQS